MTVLLCYCVHEAHKTRLIKCATAVACPEFSLQNLDNEGSLQQRIPLLIHLLLQHSAAACQSAARPSPKCKQARETSLSVQDRTLSRDAEALDQTCRDYCSVHCSQSRCCWTASLMDHVWWITKYPVLTRTSTNHTSTTVSGL